MANKERVVESSRGVRFDNFLGIVQTSIGISLAGDSNGDFSRLKDIELQTGQGTRDGPSGVGLPRESGVGDDKAGIAILGLLQPDDLIVGS